MAITRAQAEASNMIEEFLDCMTHPLEEKSCELVVEVPSGEFMLTSSYIDEAPVVIGGNQMPDDSNVTSRVFRILVDPVLSGCDGYREANVVCVWYVCVFQGLLGDSLGLQHPRVLSLSSRQGGVSRSERDRGGRRILVIALGR
ncbi:hypothetical protein Taro_013257 [Colocasia esculenta]|uniref:Uncharacterized protein n=1 Tax=Colocasia esculenta TaxID=4460 RepID=A0A843UFP8_COLES|nr:hypothetical protein [Colocasia esculenta]